MDESLDGRLGGEEKTLAGEEKSTENEAKVEAPIMTREISLTLRGSALACPFICLHVKQR